ncbi:uncharacterized protein LOC143881291 [Tasmannia lanceolata]
MDRGIEGDRLPKKSEEQMNLEEVDTSTPTLTNIELPAELRCSLCNTIFKEAVMIPCCQHSFCDKCIRLVLVEKERCPKCSSTKCRLDDLLPNVSLRQAIEHFLESQVIISGSDNTLPKYAPDDESGVQVKEVSCAISILQREPLLPHSPSATGKESNQVMAESACESRTTNNGAALGTGSRIIRLNVDKSVKSASSPHNIKQIKNGDEALESMTDFRGDSQPFKLSHAQPQKDEASKNKKGLWINTSDGSGSFMHRSRSKKVALLVTKHLLFFLLKIFNHLILLDVEFTQQKSSPFGLLEQFLAFLFFAAALAFCFSLLVFGPPPSYGSCLFILLFMLL